MVLVLSTDRLLSIVGRLSIVAHPLVVHDVDEPMEWDRYASMINLLLLYFGTVPAASTSRCCKRTHTAHRMAAALATLTDPEARKLYERVRAVYNCMHLPSSPPIPPFEEWQGVSLLCSSPICRCAHTDRWMPIAAIERWLHVRPESIVLNGEWRRGQSTNLLSFTGYLQLDKRRIFTVYIYNSNGWWCHIAFDSKLEY